MYYIELFEESIGLWMLMDGADSRWLEMPDLESAEECVRKLQAAGFKARVSKVSW
jgi:hypothetical protein